VLYIINFPRAGGGYTKGLGMDHWRSKWDQRAK